MNIIVIVEQNVIRADIMVALLDNIHDIIQTYYWGYLHNCASVVLTRLVRLFYANLVAVQDDDCRLVLQSSVDGHIIMVDPRVISQIIRVPVLQQPASPYNKVVLFPSLDDLREFFQAVPHGEERATSIRIGTLPAPHRMLSKIILYNIWLATRRSDLILKKAQFVYAVCLRLLFYLCKHILGVILEACDEGNIGLPLGCLLTQIILQSGIGVTGKPKMKIQNPISKQTQMKSNAQLRRDDQDDDPLPPPIHVAVPDMASSSQTAHPRPQQDASYAQILEALAALQSSMSSMQLAFSSMQQEVHSINIRPAVMMRTMRLWLMHLDFLCTIFFFFF
jgi:hypothetical protein